MDKSVPDRSGRKDNKIVNSMLKGATTNLKAKCGHEDMLGYFANTVCGKCARKNHKQTMGK